MRRTTIQRGRHTEPKVVIKVGAVARYQKKVLLVRERHNPAHPYRWNIIKGTFEPARDPSIVHALTREAREEARAHIKVKHLLGVYYLRDGHTSLTMFTFIADLLAPPKKIKRKRVFRNNEEDIIETRLFTETELAKLKLKDFVGTRGYLAVQDYLRGKRFPAGLITTLPPK